MSSFVGQQIVVKKVAAKVTVDKTVSAATKLKAKAPAKKVRSAAALPRWAPGARAARCTPRRLAAGGGSTPALRLRASAGRRAREALGRVRAVR
jgi:hypothetical protein